MPLEYSSTHKYGAISTTSISKYMALLIFSICSTIHLLYKYVYKHINLQVKSKVLFADRLVVIVLL